MMIRLPLRGGAEARLNRDDGPWRFTRVIVA